MSESVVLNLTFGSHKHVTIISLNEVPVQYLRKNTEFLTVTGTTLKQTGHISL